MIAIYRKYRPKKLEDVLGQETIVQILKNAARTGRLAHAYLFSGPRGSGKTTTARLIAKIANCQKRQADEKFKQLGEPCNECQACKEIDSGTAMDVIEIDAASNRGIDEIRDLKEGIRLSPSSYAYKVFIIDEVHQLTKEAFNALLKTLEEPPKHAILILATTEFEKVPATISSRTQRFNFKKVSLREIANKLEKICKLEKITYADAALELIAEAAEGSFRDAESLLDQLQSLNNAENKNAEQRGTIKVEDVEKTLGRVGFSRVSDLAGLIMANELEKSLAYINKINEEGYNITQFNKDLIHYFRKILALKFAPVLEKDFRQILTDNEVNKLKEHSKLINTAPMQTKAINLVKSLIQAYTEMRYSPFAIVPMEIAIIENLK